MEEPLCVIPASVTPRPMKRSFLSFAGSAMNAARPSATPSEPHAVIG